MAKSKNYDSRDYYNRESEGLKQRRLKAEGRWKFNPNQDYKTEDDDEDDEFYEEEEYYPR
jgi:hypothetical protein